MITVIIPAYKNTAELVSNLKHNLPFLSDCEIIVVNDDPSQSISEDLKEFKNLKLIEHAKNKGFGESVNDAVARSTQPYLFFLNSDVKLINNSFKSAVTMFEKHGNLFAVSFAQIEKDKSIVGKNRIFFKQGLVQHSKADDTQTGITAWAEGGAAIVKKSLFLELGAFDPIYSPFYWEDIDLSYRAWKTGYEVLFRSDIQVIHHHESTIGTFFDKNTVKRIAYRNQLLFTWKNITAFSLLLGHIFQLPLYLLKALFRGDLTFILAFFQALASIPYVVSSKLKSKHETVKSDREIFDMFAP